MKLRGEIVEEEGISTRGKGIKETEIKGGGGEGREVWFQKE